MARDQSTSIISHTPIYVNDIVVLKDIWSVYDPRWIDKENYVDDIYVVEYISPEIVRLRSLFSRGFNSEVSAIFTHVELCKL